MLVSCKRHQGYTEIGEAGYYDLPLDPTLTSVWQVVYLRSWAQEKVDGPGLLLPFLNIHFMFFSHVIILGDLNTAHRPIDHWDAVNLVRLPLGL